MVNKGQRECPESEEPAPLRLQKELPSSRLESIN